MTRWINFLALLVLVGALLFLVVVWHRPGSMFARPAEVERRFDARWHALLRWSWATAAVITIIAVWAQGAVAAGVPLATALSPIILWEVLGTRFGVVAVVKLAVLVIGAALWILASHRFAAAWRAPVPRSVGAGARTPAVSTSLVGGGALFALVLVLTPGLAGHAGTTPPVALNLAADAAHVLAAALWLGGLVVLLWAAFPATRQLQAGERVRTLAPVVGRFSDGATWP